MSNTKMVERAEARTVIITYHCSSSCQQLKRRGSKTRGCSKTRKEEKVTLIECNLGADPEVPGNPKPPNAVSSR